jgi:hypothetical protein
VCPALGRLQVSAPVSTFARDAESAVRAGSSCDLSVLPVLGVSPLTWLARRAILVAPDGARDAAIKKRVPGSPCVLRIPVACRVRRVKRMRASKRSQRYSVSIVEHVQLSQAQLACCCTPVSVVYCS